MYSVCVHRESWESEGGQRVRTEVLASSHEQWACHPPVNQAALSEPEKQNKTEGRVTSHTRSVVGLIITELNMKWRKKRSDYETLPGVCSLPDECFRVKWDRYKTAGL